MKKLALALAATAAFAGQAIAADMPMKAATANGCSGRGQLPTGPVATFSGGIGYGLIRSRERRALAFATGA